MNNPYDELRLEDLIKACVRRISSFILALFLVGLLMGGFLLLKCVIRPGYTANSVVLIYPRNTTSDAGLGAADGKLGAKELAALKDASSSYIDLLGNRWVIYTALGNLGVAPDDIEEFIRENVVITNIGESPYLGVEITYSDAETAYRINNEMIRILPSVLEDFNISANVAVISYPIIPAMPNLPSTLVLAAVGGGAWLVLGFVLVLMMELFDPTIRTEKDIRRILALESMSYLPKTYKRTSGRLFKRTGAAYVRAAANLILFPGRVIVFFSPPGCSGLIPLLAKIAEQLVRAGCTAELHNLCPNGEGKTALHISDDLSKALAYCNASDRSASAKPDAVPTYLQGLLAKPRPDNHFILLLAPTPDAAVQAAECFTRSDLAVLLLRYGKIRGRAAELSLDIVRKAGAKECACVLWDIPARGPCNAFRDFSG